MVSESPISVGFRTAFREPAVVLAEIAWRWTFGFAAWVLVVASFLAYLDTLPITRTELLMLRSRIPGLVADAVGQIFSGSGGRLTMAVAIVLPAILAIWILCASLGRAATLKALLRREGRLALAPQFGLSFLRASVTLASLIGYLGALILAGRAAAATAEIRSGVFFVVFVVLGTATAVVRSRLNWFLSLAAIFAACDGSDTFSAINEAIGLFRRRAGRFTGVGAAFGTIHVALFGFTSMVALLALSLAVKVPTAVTLFLLAVITLGYFAAVDFLHVARLGAYLAIDESDRLPPPIMVASVPPPAPQPPIPVLPAGPGLPSPEGATS